MKTKTTLLTLLGLLLGLENALGYTESPVEKQIKNLIDWHCADTWCESTTYEYRFETLMINNGRATLFFTEIGRKIIEGQDGEEREIFGDEKPAICHFDISVKDNVEELTDYTITQIDKCISSPKYIQ